MLYSLYCDRNFVGRLLSILISLQTVIFATDDSHAQAIVDSPVSEAPIVTESVAIDANTTTYNSTVLGAAHEDLDATLWMQSSPEYNAACRQTYRSAIRQLGVMLTDTTASALPEQAATLAHPNSGQLPTAVILDVDETVLDNSAYQAHLIETGGQYSPDDWAEWTSDAPSPLIPGAKEFLTACQAAGVTAFFVTNRDTKTKEATRTNLEKYQLVTRNDEVDALLCKYDQETWTSDKATRRAHLAKSYRILLLIGDDLNDFVSVGIKPTSAARLALMEQHEAHFGKDWFVLPNPTYGGWERAIHGWRDQSSRETKVGLKRKALRLDPPSSESL